MKTYKLFLVAFFLMGLSTANGQLKGVNINLGGGLTLAKISSSGYYSEPSKLTARSSFGVFADKKITSSISARTGLFYNGLGESYTYANKKMQDEFNYLSLPLQVLYPLKNTPFSVFGGPQVSLLINAARKTEGNSIVMVTDEFRRVMVNGTAGLLCKVTPRTSASFEYERSFYNAITKEFAGNIDEGSKYQHVGFALRVYFRLSK